VFLTTQASIYIYVEARDYDGTTILISSKICIYFYMCVCVYVCMCVCVYVCMCVCILHSGYPNTFFFYAPPSPEAIANANVLLNSRKNGLY
jgi:hypothetical protein